MPMTKTTPKGDRKPMTKDICEKGHKQTAQAVRRSQPVLAALMAVATLTSGTATTALAEGSARDWAGPYAGIYLGVIDNETDYDYTGQVFGNPFEGTATSSDIEISGGLQAGYNWAVSSRMVAGLELSYGLSDSSDRATDVRPARAGLAPSLGVTHTLTTLGSVRGRLGYTMGQGLVFVTGGFAFGEQESDITVQPGNRIASYRDDVTGWTVGAGFAYKLTETMSLQSEYAYTDFGSEDLYNRVYTFPVPASANLSAEGHVHQIKVGLNFHF